MRNLSLMGIVVTVLLSTVNVTDLWAQPEITRVFPSQIVIGEQQEIVVFGKGISTVSSIEISPSEGIQINNIAIMELSQEYTDAGLQAWSLNISADENIQVEASAKLTEQSLENLREEGGLTEKALDVLKLIEDQEFSNSEEFWNVVEAKMEEENFEEWEMQMLNMQKKKILQHVLPDVRRELIMITPEGNTEPIKIPIVPVLFDIL